MHILWKKDFANSVEYLEYDPAAISYQLLWLIGSFATIKNALNQIQTVLLYRTHLLVRNSWSSFRAELLSFGLCIEVAQMQTCHGPNPESSLEQHFTHAC